MIDSARFVAVAALAWAVAAAPGCTRDRDAADAPASAAARYFAALSAGRCDELLAAAGGDLAAKLRERGCDAAFEEARTHHLEYVRVSGSQPDGRRPSAMLLDVELRFDGKGRTVVARAEKVGGRWTLVTL